MERLIRPSERQEDQVQKMGRVRSRLTNRTFLGAISERLGLARRSGSSRSARPRPRNPGITPEEYASRVATSTLAKRISVLPVGSTYIRIAVKDPARAGAPPRGRRGEAHRGDARSSWSARRRAVNSARTRSPSSARTSAARRRPTGRPRSASWARASPRVPWTRRTSKVRQLSDAAEKEAEQVSERIRTDLQTWSGRAGSARLPDLRTGRTAELEGRLSLESSYGAAAAAPAAARERRASCSRSARRGRSFSTSTRTPRSRDLPDDARQIAAGVALDRSVLARSEPGISPAGMVGSYMREVRGTPAMQMELEAKKAEVTKRQELLATLEQEAASSRISEAMQTSQLSFRIEVIEAPWLLKPVWPDRVKVLLGALLLGPLFGVGIIVGAERVGAILRTVEQAEEEMGTEVIGTIPRRGWSRRDPSSRTTGRRCRFSPCCSSRLW